MSVKLEYFPEMSDYYHPIVDAQPKASTKNSSKVSSADTPAKKRGKTHSTAWINNNMQRIQELLLELCDKYFLVLSDQEMRRLLGKIRTMRESSNAIKGHLELAAVVVFYQYSDIIRLSMKEYCARNQLNIKIFNKNYKLYHAIFRKGLAYAQSEEEDAPVDSTQKSTSQEDERECISAPKRLDRNNITNPRQAIDHIYDCIFKSSYFQENRRELIEKMAVRCEEIDRRIFDAMEWTETYSLKMYYIIFSFIRQFGAQVKFRDYSRAVLERTGLLLRRNYSEMTDALFKRTQSEDNEADYRDAADYQTTCFGIDEEDQDLFEL